MAAVGCYYCCCHALAAAAISVCG
eukprot:COSAG01_NODE_29048_length_646_cov_2.268739_2_plen_23_part_01